MVSDVNEVKTALSILTELAGSEELFDIHTHPFNVADSVPSYEKETSGRTGIFTRGYGHYVPPGLETEEFDENVISTEDEKNGDVQFDQHLLKKFYLLKSRKTYNFTGPGVLIDNMALAGIKRALLLPVARPEDEGDAQMLEMERLFGAHQNFLMGYCVPNDCKIDKIVQEVGRVRNRFKVAALKIHPNITGIDPSSRGGLDRIHHILEASKTYRLPVIIHGGYSREFSDGDAMNFGCLNRLVNVAWETTDQPVIIAHAGLFGCGREEILKSGLPQIMSLLIKHDHLLVDLAGLGQWTIQMIVKKLEPERILFGSDALYFSIWRSAVLTLIALMKTDFDAGQIFHRFAGINPGRYIFRDSPDVTADSL